MMLLQKGLPIPVVGQIDPDPETAPGTGQL